MSSGDHSVRARSSRERVLVVLRALGLGDFLTGLPALRALDRGLPGHTPYLAAPPVQRELLDLAGLGRWRLLPAHGPCLTGPADAAAHPHLAVNLHGRGPQSTAALEALGPERLWGHAGTGERPWGPPWREDLHDAVLWSRLVSYYGVPADPADLRLAAPPPGPGAGAAVVHPGAAAPARRWPEERYAAVARRLAARGLEVAVTAGPGEAEAARRVARAAGPGVHAAPQRTPTALAALVAAAPVLVCADTGVGHLGTALGTPSVLLFGPKPPALWGPLIDRERHTCLWAGRFGDPNGDRPDSGLLRLTAEEVAEAAERTVTAPGAVRERPARA